MTKCPLVFFQRSKVSAGGGGGGVHMHPMNPPGSATDGLKEKGKGFGESVSTQALEKEGVLWYDTNLGGRGA